ncbi:permease prefix domain 1-containing protein [Clostridium culturomicium]|uniref:permease prefix domain 1-containing protein n=1 Tax=Clostridium culturomicium TaxID=1499683 RepID=UPI003857BFBA
METIRIYVENMFKALPKTGELKKLKQDILMNMEDKYAELKSEGKTENEAIGIVISEFGNIDEIIREFEIEVNQPSRNVTSEKENLPSMDLEEAKKYLRETKKCNFLISIGGALCMMGAAVLVFMYQLYDDGIIFRGLVEDKAMITPLIILLAFVGVAVALFIFAGISMEKYKYIDKGYFNLQPSARIILEEEGERLRTKSTIGTIVGVVLCILSPIILFLSGMKSESGYVYGTTLLILVIAVAVFIFINISTCNEGHKKLLKEGEYNPKVKEENKVIGAVAGVVWPLTVMVFLIWGIAYDGWEICWIVFPIVGVIFGGFCNVYKSVKGIED